VIDQKNKFLFIHIPRTAGSGFCNEYHEQKLSDGVSYPNFLYDYFGISDTTSYSRSSRIFSKYFIKYKKRQTENLEALEKPIVSPNDPRFDRHAFKVGEGIGAARFDTPRVLMRENERRMVRRWKHFGYKQYCERFPSCDFKSFYKVTVVRNSWDLVVSNYWRFASIYWGMRSEPRPLDLFSMRAKKFRTIRSVKTGKITARPTFHDFVSFLAGRQYERVGGRYEKFGPYACGLMYDFIDGCEDDVVVVRYENYDAEMKPVFDQLGMSYKHKKRTPEQLKAKYLAKYSRERPNDYREMYNASTKDIVWNLYRKDIKKFGYEF